MRRNAFALLALLPFVAAAGPDAGCSAGPPPPDPGFAARQADYLAFAAEGTSGGGLHTQIARLALGRPIDPAPVRSSVAKIVAREDTADFGAVALLRLLYAYGESPQLDPGLRAEIEAALLGFKYWIDEPGTDTMVYWSENHQILFATAEYLAGQRWPDEVFPNAGMTGREHQEKARPRILGWLRDRARFGFSEWLSNTYYEEDAAPLLALADFADDAEIRTRAAMVFDLLAYDMALNSHRGVFGTTHGRAYRSGKMGGRRESTAVMQALLFDQGLVNSTNSFGGVALATSTSYAPPAVLADVARDASGPWVNRQRQSITLEEGPRYGYGYDDYVSGMFWWGLEAIGAWQTVDVSFDMAETYGLFGEGGFFAPFEFLLGWPRGLVVAGAALLAPITEVSLLEKVNVYTYHTPDGMLSSAQDKMKGYFSGQHHAWQATLDVDAVVWTTHPGPFTEGETGGLSLGADYWTGGSSLPRVGQHENVAIVLYDPLVETMLGGALAGAFPDLTHAYFPRAAFDEVVETGGWTIGRKGTGYVALWSANPTRWATDGPWVGVDLIADGPRNAWVCELGSEALDGSFADFVARIAAAEVGVVDPATLAVRYVSPRQGLVELAWDGPLVVAGVERDLGDYPRYANPFSDVRWGAERMVVARGDRSLTLDFARGTRTGT